MLVGHPAGHAVEDLLGAPLDLPIVIVGEQLSRPPGVRIGVPVRGGRDERLFDEHREHVQPARVGEGLVMLEHLGPHGLREALENRGREKDVVGFGKTIFGHAGLERVHLDSGLLREAGGLVYALLRDIEGVYPVSAPGKEDGVAAFPAADVEDPERSVRGQEFKDFIANVGGLGGPVQGGVAVTLVVLFGGLVVLVHWGLLWSRIYEGGLGGFNWWLGSVAQAFRPR